MALCRVLVCIIPGCPGIYRNIKSATEMSRERLTIVKPDFKVDIVDEGEVYIQDQLVYSVGEGFAPFITEPEPEMNDDIVIPGTQCSAVNSGGDTTVVIVDGHIFDSEEYDVVVTLKRKKDELDEG